MKRAMLLSLLVFVVSFLATVLVRLWPELTRPNRTFSSQLGPPETGFGSSIDRFGRVEPGPGFEAGWNVSCPSARVVCNGLGRGRLGGKAPSSG